MSRCEEGEKIEGGREGEEEIEKKHIEKLKNKSEWHRNRERQTDQGGRE
jgi:hypothetical protein